MSQIWISGSPNIRKSGLPKIRIFQISESPEFRTSEKSCVRKFWFGDFRKFDFLDFRTSENSNFRIFRKPGKSEFPDFSQIQKIRISGFLGESGESGFADFPKTRQFRVSRNPESANPDCRTFAMRNVCAWNDVITFPENIFFNSNCNCNWHAVPQWIPQSNKCCKITWQLC